MASQARVTLIYLIVICLELIIGLVQIVTQINCVNSLLRDIG